MVAEEETNPNDSNSLLTRARQNTNCTTTKQGPCINGQPLLSLTLKTDPYCTMVNEEAIIKTNFTREVTKVTKTLSIIKPPSIGASDKILIASITYQFLYYSIVDYQLIRKITRVNGDLLRGARSLATLSQRPTSSHINKGLYRIPSNQQLHVVRRVYLQEALNIEAEYHSPDLTWFQLLKKMIRKCGYLDCLKNAIPMVYWLPKYKSEYLLPDFVAGATVSVLHIPQGIAYAFLAYCTPTVGLYMAFFPILAYVVFGTSPHICLGTFAVSMLMTGKVVLEHANVPNLSVGAYTPDEVVSALSFNLAMWCLRLGAVSSLLSEPLVSGLTTAASFHVCASQAKDLIGVIIPKLPTNFKIIYTVIELYKLLPQTNWFVFVLSFISCFFLAFNNEVLKPWFSKRSNIPLPAELIVVVSSTLFSRYMNLQSNYGVPIIGNIPTGLPTPALPPFELCRHLILDGLTLTMVTYTITMSMGLIFANMDKYEIDSNQELLALGVSNLVGCFFFCAPPCASLSRSYLQHAVGGKTLVTSLISAMLLLLVILWIAPLFETIPRSVLASIIIVSLKNLYLKVYDFVRFWKLSKLDAGVWCVTFSVTFLVNVDYGLVAGLFASIGSLYYRAQTHYCCILGRVLDTDLYLDVKRYRAAHEITGIKIFHYCGALNFASRNDFRNNLFRKTGFLRLIDSRQKSTESKLTIATAYVWDIRFHQKTHCIIIDASALSYVDAPGIKTLVELSKFLTSKDIITLLAGANAPILEMIDKFNKLKKIESKKFQMLTFPSVHDAVAFYNLMGPQKRQSLLFHMK